MKLSEIKQFAVGERIDLDKLPQEFVARVIEEEVKVDNHQRQCLYWTIQIIVDGKLYVFTQKFTPMFMGFLSKAMESLAVDDTAQFKDTPFKFIRKDFTDSKFNPRWFPVAKTKSNPFKPFDEGE